jgi:hypothetical protein
LPTLLIGKEATEEAAARINKHAGTLQEMVLTDVRLPVFNSWLTRNRSVVRKAGLVAACSKAKHIQSCAR